MIVARQKVSVAGKWGTFSSACPFCLPQSHCLFLFLFLFFSSSSFLLPNFFDWVILFFRSWTPLASHCSTFCCLAFRTGELQRRSDVCTGPCTLYRLRVVVVATASAVARRGGIVAIRLPFGSFPLLRNTHDLRTISLCAWGAMRIAIRVVWQHNARMGKHKKYSTVPPSFLSRHWCLLRAARWTCWLFETRDGPARPLLSALLFCSVLALNVSSLLTDAIISYALARRKETKPRANARGEHDWKHDRSRPSGGWHHLTHTTAAQLAEPAGHSIAVLPNKRMLTLHKHTDRCYSAAKSIKFEPI